LRALDDGREDLRVLAFGWVAVRVDDEVVIAVVRRLEWRPRFDVDELASGYVVSLGRVVDIHRQDPAEDDEGLLLMPVVMTATLRAGFVAPHIPTRVPEIRNIAELGNMPRAGSPGSCGRVIHSQSRWRTTRKPTKGDSRKKVRRLSAAQDLAGPAFGNVPERDRRRPVVSNRAHGR
jgi:hypothetical protein